MRNALTVVTKATMLEIIQTALIWEKSQKMRKQNKKQSMQPEDEKIGQEAKHAR